MTIIERAQQALTTAVVRSAGVWERLESGIAFDIGTQGFVENPHPIYRRLREENPVHRSRLTGGWIFTRYDDVLTLLRDSRLSSDYRHQANWPRIKKRMLKSGRTEEDLNQPSILNSDAPRHTRLRGLFSKAFTPRAVRALEPRMRQVVGELLDAAKGKSEIELVEALAYPLPVTIIAEMLGVPTADQDKFRRWSDEIVSSLGANDLDTLRTSFRAGRELTEYLEPIAEERRREPREDLLSGLLAAEEHGDRLTMEEVYQTVITLLVAGNETTTKLIGNGVLTLLRNPEQLQLLSEQPELIDTAVDELMRWEGPVHATGRSALEDFEYEGAKIRKGQMVLVGISSANRDPAHFSDPERLDITRTHNPHVGFGHGMHFCPGSSLARMEARVAIGALVERYPAMKLAVERPVWGPNMALRGLVALPVRV